MPDRSQGTAHPLVPAIPAHLVSETNADVRFKIRPYCGSSPLRPRRGRSTTARARLRKLGCFGLQPIALEPGDYAHAGVACWNRDDHWITWAVPIAYAQHYPDVLPQLGGPKNGISLPVLTKIAAAHAVHADYRTGRNCRPSVDRIAQISGYSERTVQRARQVMRLIGVATEIVRGRQRTLDERLASHRVGDNGRGWASVYALHSPQVVDKRAGNTSAAPHPEGRPLGRSSLVGNSSLTPTGKAGELQGHAARDQANYKRKLPGRQPDPRGQLLASRWRQNPRTPEWARRYSPAAWSHVLAKPAALGWTDRDLNQLLRDHTLVGNGNWIAHDPQRPILLLAGILKQHGDLENRPAALDDARQDEHDQKRRNIAACNACDEYGWLLPYGDIAVRCTHQPLAAIHS